MEHGFVRGPRSGMIISFDPLGSKGTEPAAVSAAGVVTGSYYTLSSHGFLRAPEGRLTTFDPPGSAGTFPAAINLQGLITGSYIDAGLRRHGFLLRPDLWMTASTAK